MSVWLSFCPSIILSVCQSVGLSVSLFVLLSACLSVLLSVRPFICMSLCLSIHLDLSVIIWAVNIYDIFQTASTTGIVLVIWFLIDLIIVLHLIQVWLNSFSFRIYRIAMVVCYYFNCYFNQFLQYNPVYQRSFWYSLIKSSTDIYIKFK